MDNADIIYKEELKKVLWRGGIIRYVFLFLVIVVFKNSTDPYLLSDDILYEDNARQFLLGAQSIFDLRVASIIGIDNYQSVFWPFFLCFSAKILGTEYAGRIINCLLSVVCIYQIYRLTHLITDDKSSALKAAKLFAYLPYPWFICCFPFKDIFLTFAVLYVFIIFLKVQKSIQIPLTHLIIAALLLVAVYFTRGGVVEVLLILGCVFMCSRIISKDGKRKFFYLLLLAIIALASAFFFYNGIVDAFTNKINTYNTVDYISSGAMRVLQINSLYDIWKIPATYFFAMLQPMTLNLFAFDGGFSWRALLGILNLTIFPIAIGNMVYMFSRKYNVLFWVLSFIMYASVFSLSLGIFRHYLFLFPLIVINYACNDSMCKPYSKGIIRYGSVFLYIIVIFNGSLIL